MTKLYFRKSISKYLGKNTAKVISNEQFKDKYALKTSHIIHLGDAELQKAILELNVVKHNIKQEKITENTRLKILVLTYPIFKVANVDTNYEKKRRQLLNRILINFLSEIFGSNLSRKERKKLAQLYINDFQFINEHKEKFNYALLFAATGFSLEIKNSIVRLMIKMVEASGGVGELEFGMIDYLTKEFLS